MVPFVQKKAGINCTLVSMQKLIFINIALRGFLDL